MPASSMKTVLLIDDDRTSRVILSQWLTKAGWKVVEAEDGQEGLEAAKKESPDVVLCDLLMPRCNGFQVCRALRDHPGNLRHSKIIVTTSSGYPTDRVNALEAGADEFLVKPIKQAELLDLLDRLTTPGTEYLRRKTGDQMIFRRADERFDEPQPTGATDHPMKVKFWGVRGSIPTPGPATAFYGGNTSCIEVRAEGEIIILDAGTGIRPLGLQLLSEFEGKPIRLTLLMTHTHWDHIQGFPFFVPAYNPKNKLRIMGYEGAREGLGSTLSSQMESPYFPISMQEMPGYIAFHELKDMSFTVGQVRVQAAFLNHPGVCAGYRLFSKAGSVAYLPDNESFLRLKSKYSTEFDEHHAETLEYARKQDRKLADFVQDADVLIIDSQYDAEEYQKHIGWGHTCVDDSVAFALSANVKRLFLFHHDPGHDDAKIAQMEAHARDLVAKQGANLQVEAAREGVEVVLHPQAKTGRSKH